MLFDVIMYSLCAATGCGIAFGIGVIVRIVRKSRELDRDFFSHAQRKEFERIGRPTEVKPKQCAHPYTSLVPVESSGEIVAFLCTAAPCDEQVMPDHGQAQRWLYEEEKKRKRAKADREFAAMFSGLQDDRAQAIERRDMARAELAVANRDKLSPETVKQIVNEATETAQREYSKQFWQDIVTVNSAWSLEPIRIYPDTTQFRKRIEEEWQ